MRRSRLMFVVGLVIAAGLPGRAAGQAVPGASPAARPDGAETIVAPPSDRLAIFRQKVAKFVAEFYLTGDSLTDDELAVLYAPEVAYFGDRVLSRARVLADKRSYYRRWPSRSYRLIEDTLTVVEREGQGRVYDVTFEYTFDVSSGDRVSKGRGRGQLTLDLRGDGGRITRETGRVLERWR